MTIDQQISDALERRHPGCEVDVVRYLSSYSSGCERAVWYGLAIKLPGEMWQQAGRRQTKAELVELAKRWEPWTYQSST
jgi:hypothetical protein